MSAGHYISDYSIKEVESLVTVYSHTVTVDFKLIKAKILIRSESFQINKRSGK